MTYGPDELDDDLDWWVRRWFKKVYRNHQKGVTIYSVTIYSVMIDSVTIYSVTIYSVTIDSVTIYSVTIDSVTGLLQKKISKKCNSPEM